MGASSSTTAKSSPASSKDELLAYDLPSQTYWTHRPDGEAPIQFSKRGRASKESCPSITVHEAFARAAKTKPNQIAMCQEPVNKITIPSGGKPPGALPKEEWRTWTYQQYYLECRQAAKAMIKLGFAAHDSCSVYGFNSPEWFISQWGAQFAGGKVAGIYPSDTAPQVQFKVFHSNASIACVESAKELKLFASIIDELPYIKAIICWAHDNKGQGLVRADGTVVRVLTWSEFLAIGNVEPEVELENRLVAQRPGHCCALIYTSGTTGNPKAVMISHDNVVSEVFVVMMDGIVDVATKFESERIISYLPLSHVAGMLVDIVTPVFMTAFKAGWIETYFARPYDLKAGSLGDRLRFVKPTIFLGVPRVWEKIAEKMKAVGAKTTGLKKVIATWAKAKGLQYQKNRQVGGNGAKPFNYGLAEKIVLSKVKMALGLDECKFGFTGAAPMSVDVQVYFAQLGININEVYGMSECTGATTWSTESCHQWGSVGYALPGQEIKIFKIDAQGKKTECPRARDVNQPTEVEQGEICFRGRHIMMGYMANPKLGNDHILEIQKKNKEAIDNEGWLHSGDKGAMSQLGMVRITGRYKELIMGAGGENIAPVPIEDEIKKICGAVSNVQMIGDKRKFNICLVTLKAIGATGELPGGDDLDPQAVAFCSPGITTISAAMNDKTLIKAVTDAITVTNKNGMVCPSNASTVQKFTILPRDFSVETNELTATLKLKRSVVEEKHKQAIDNLYESNENYVSYDVLTGGARKGTAGMSGEKVPLLKE